MSVRSYRDVAPLPAALEPAGTNGARFILKDREAQTRTCKWRGSFTIGMRSITATRGGAVRDGARDMVRRYIDLLLIFTMCDTDQARVVGIVWQALAIANERVE